MAILPMAMFAHGYMAVAPSHIVANGHKPSKPTLPLHLATGKAEMVEQTVDVTLRKNLHGESRESRETTQTFDMALQFVLLG